MMLVKIHPVLNPKICLNPQPLYSSQINETHFTDRYRDAVLAFATDEQKQLFRANQNRHLTITRPNSFQEKLMQQLIHIAKLFLDQDNSVKLSEPVKFDFAESLCRVSNDTTENFYYCTRMLLLQCKSPSDISSLLAHYRYQLVLKACASKIIYSSIKLYIDVANAMGLAIEFDEEKSLIDLKYISQSIIKSIEKVFTDEFTPEHLATNLLNNELRKRGYIGYQHAGYNESNCMELMEWLQIILELYQDPHRLNLVFKDRYNLFIMQQDKIVDLNWPNITSMFIGILIPSNVFENFVPLSPLLQYKGNGFHYRLELLGSQQNDGSILMRYEVESVSERRNTQRDYYNRFLYMPSPDNRRWQDRGVSPYSFPEELHAGLYSLVMQRLPSIVKSKESSLCILRFFNSDHAFHLLNNIQNNFFLYFKRIEKFIEVVKQLNEEHCYLLTYFLVKMDARILSPHPELVPWLEQLELPQRRSVLKALSPHCHGFFNLSLQAFVMYYETVSAEQRKEWLISKKQVLQNFCQSPAELKFVYQHIELHNDLFEILRDLLFLHINSLKLLSEFIPYFDKKHITDCHQHIIRRCGDDINNLDEFRTRMSLVPKDEVNNFLVSRIESLHMIVTDKFQLKRLIEMCPPHAEIEYCRLLKDLILKFLANAHDLYVVSWNMNSLSFCGIYQVIYEYAPMTVEQMLIEFPDFRKPSYNYSECQKIILRKISAIDDPLQILAFLQQKISNLTYSFCLDKLKDLIQSRQNFALVLGFLEDPKANQVNNLFEICISRLKTINTAYALRAFMQSLSEQQMTGLCRHFRAQICAHFESIDDYNYILRQLTAQQQTILCTQLQRHLIDLLKTPSDFTQIMRYTDVDFIHQLFHEFKAIYFVNIMDAAIRDTQVCAFFIKVMGTIDLSKRKAVFQHLLCHEQTENQAVQRFSEKYTALFSHSLRSFFSKSNFITQQNPLTCQKIIDHAAKEPGSRTAEVIYCWM